MTDCNTPVGVEDGRITNQQMMASSRFNEHYAYCGRLNNQVGPDEKGKLHWGGWCTDKSDKNQYLQVHSCLEIATYTLLTLSLSHQAS